MKYLERIFSALFRARWFFAGACIIVLAIMVATPITTRAYLNKYVLADMGTYSGHVEDVDINYITGAYGLKGLKIIKKSTTKTLPFFNSTEMWVNLSWKQLLKGELSFSILAVEPELRFQDAKKDSDSQTGKGGLWFKTIQRVMPSSLTEVNVHQGQLIFINEDSKPTVDVRVSEIELNIKGLHIGDSHEQTKSATTLLNASLLEQGKLYCKINFNPANYGDFNLDFKAEDINLKQLNDIGRVYGNLDFDDGEGKVYSEISGDGAEFSGYIKPFFENVDILSWKQDVEKQGDNIFQFAWEGIAGFTQNLLTNPFTDKFATEITIKGSTDGVQVDSAEAILGVFKNAFIDALNEGFDEKEIAIDE